MTTWAPRPPDTDSFQRRHDYYAGYNDAFYGYAYGVSHTEPNADYRQGYTDGQASG